MGVLLALVSRNVKLFFKDRGMFFISLITPMILLLLFITFLGNIYRDVLTSAIPEHLHPPKALIEGFVGGWLFSSLLAVSCVTVAFCSNMLMVQDKALGIRNDLTIAPLRPTTLALSYLIATAVCTLTICAATMCAGFVYLRCVGWYMTAADVLLTLADVLMLVTLGTLLSSVVGHFLSTQGQMSALSAIITACYGFLCGAYMPISSFGKGIRDLISLMPGTYGTVLLRGHMMGGALRALEELPLPPQAIDQLRLAFDSDLYFFGAKVEKPVLYAVLLGSIAALLGVYVLLNRQKRRRKASAEGTP